LSAAINDQLYSKTQYFNNSRLHIASEHISFHWFNVCFLFDDSNDSGRAVYIVFHAISVSEQFFCILLRNERAVCVYIS